MTLGEKLLMLYPEVDYDLQDDDYSTLIWPGGNKPPEQEIENAYQAFLQAQASAPQAMYDQAIESGFTVSPEGFTLRLGDVDRAQFSQMLALVKEALDLGMITDETSQTIADKDHVIHEVSTLRFRQIMVGYGLHYKTLWDNLASAQ